MITLPKNKLKDRELVFGYGFDRAGFTTGHAPIALNAAATVQFVDLYSPRSLTEADGVIIPQGIFEHIETRSDVFSELFGEKTFVSVDRPLMLERERQVFTMLRDGKWVCFMVGEINDHIAQGLYSEPILDTDLCKRVLNAFGIGRRRRYRLESPLELKVRDEEFKPYVMRFGAPTTVFELPKDGPTERHAIAWLGRGVVGMEFDAQLYFLPFQTSQRTQESATQIVTLLTSAINQHRRYRIVEAPDWVDDFHFKSEEPLYLQINDLLEKLNRLETELACWKDYKAILSSSGMYLRNKLIALFESVFELRIQEIDGEERFLILKEDDWPLVLLQSEGTEGEVQKASIERLSQARKEHGLTDSFPAVLVINDHMSSTSVASRPGTTLSHEVLQCAAEHKVLVVRTIDLLFLINLWTNNSDKKSRMLNLLTSGGGWLKATTGSYDVIHP